MTRKAVLFDLDGVLVDTERLKSRAHQETVARFGGVLSDAVYQAVLGRSSGDVAQYVIRQAGIRPTVTEYERAFGVVYDGLVDREARPTVGAVDFLHELKADGYQCALVSSAGRQVVDRILAQLQLTESFDVIVAAQDVASHKPSPEPYTRALDRLGLTPSEAVAFEDTESGVAAAVAAGLRVVVVCHSLNQRHDFSKADAQIAGFGDLASVLRLTGSLLRGRA